MAANKILFRYFTPAQIEKFLKISGDTVTAGAHNFRVTSHHLELIEIAPGGWMPDHLTEPDRRTWEAVAALKVGFFVSRQATVASATSGAMYDEDYYTRRGGGSPYTGYPFKEDGSSEVDRMTVLADVLLLRHSEARILDVCATGILVQALQERGVEAWGVDFSAWAVANAVCGNVIRADARNLDRFRSEYFDVVISQDFFEHVPTDAVQSVLSELHRVTTSCGWNYHFIPFYSKHRVPIAIDAHLTTASKAWWDSSIQNCGLFDMVNSAPCHNQWDYSEGGFSHATTTCKSERPSI